MADDYTYVGKRVPKIDSRLIVSGGLRYLHDVEIPGMLWGKFLRSPYPHAKIVKVDFTQAERLPGVVAVLNPWEVYERTKPTGGIPEQYCLNLKARYVGDEVAAVAAVDEETAERAVDLIKVEYEKLPSVTDVEEAMKPGAPKIHDGSEQNICYKPKLRAGDIDKGFREADVVVKRRFKTSKQTACQVPNGAISSFNAASGKLEHLSTTQSLMWIQRGMSHILGIPQYKVRAIKPEGLCCGFGHKSAGPYPFDVAAALLSMKTGRPVKMVLSREECFIGHRSRHPMVRYAELGVKKDGTITALRDKMIMDTGAYSTHGPLIALQAQWTTVGPYKIPNVWIDTYLVYTNKLAACSFRGFGDPQSTFVRESLLDMAAEEIGLDTAEIRRINFIKPGDLPYKNSTGQIVRSCGVEKCLDEVMRVIKWGEKRPANRGVGLASMIQWSTALTRMQTDLSTVIVRLNIDGSAHVYTSTMEMGQGINTMLAQIVAEELSIPIEKVVVLTADSDVTPPDLGSFGSRSATTAGTSAYNAARDARNKVLDLASKMLSVKSEDLSIKAGTITVKGSPEKKLTVQEVAEASYLGKVVGGQAIIGVGAFNVVGEKFDENGCGNLSPDYAFSVNAVEVEVDPETGIYRLLSYIAGQDAGKVINRMATEGQIRGGAIQAIGYTMNEDLVYDKNGQPLMTSFKDYKIPTFADVPPITPITVETFSPVTSHGQKGVGETALNCTAAAIANAIYNAVGVRVREMPITPEKILKALKEGKKEYPFE